MGIKFVCQSCSHKLHVKSFLAGKRGVCPHCGSAVDIPNQSDPNVGKNGGTSPAVSAIISHSANSPSAVARAAYAAQPVAPFVAQPVAPRATPVSVASVAYASPATTPSPMPIPAAPAPVARPDPINEAPNAVWYVQPPAGGRYGPANGEVMRRWLTEGRVSADSLVWRDGWSDWRNASSVFPELGGGPMAQGSAIPPSPTVATGVPLMSPASAAPSTSRSPVRSRRRSNSTVLVAVVTLCFLTVALLIALVIVLRGGV